MNTNLAIDVSGEIFFINTILKRIYSITGNQYNLDYIEIFNDYLLTLRNKETIRCTYSPLEPHEIKEVHLGIINDQSLLESTVSTLESKLRFEVINVPEDCIYLICNSVYNCLVNLASNLYEMVSNNNIDIVMKFNFEVVRSLTPTMFLVSEKAIGSDFFEPTFKPWVYLS